MNYDFRFDPAPTEVNKTPSIDIPEKLNRDRLTKSVGLSTMGKTPLASAGKKAAIRAVRNFRFVYTCADIADLSFLSNSKKHFRQRVGFSW